MAAARTNLRFLLEIGSEEIPDWMIASALDHLKSAFERMLADLRLPGTVDWVDGTPRRLALLASGLAGRQADLEELVSGPPKAAGEGAALGFARKNGVTVDQLEIQPTPKGDYYAFRRRIAGRAASELLAAAAPDLILGIPWPKTMCWTGKGGPRFIRPIRWIVALLNGAVVDFEVAGVRSGDRTSGHRRFGRKTIRVSVAGYVEQLRKNHVLVRASERRARIEAGLAGVRVKPDPGLLDTLTYLTEWPTPVVGRFDEAYLDLPAEVLVTVMRHHQKYFSVEREDGSLAPGFVAVMNVPADPDGLVVSGNERVLRARFNDARFFWETDQKKPLRDRVEDLKHVTFQRNVGSYHLKMTATLALLDELGDVPAAARRAVELCKCDLTTEMVKEFTELQGVVGGLYARAQGEGEDVAAAIYEHYKPVSMEDSIPATEAGRFVALADKLHTLRACFAVGMAPTGSKDPLALRRAAQGAVRILVEGGLPVDFAKLSAGDAALDEFLRDRVRHYFRDVRGFAYDEVNAAMAAGLSNLPDLTRRLEAIRAVRPTADFEPLAASFKRIRNILEQARFEGCPVDPDLLQEDAERGLYRAMTSLRLAGLSYREALTQIATLRPAVDLFFDKVLVNAPEPRVRANRLALLDTLRREFSRIADFSEIVTS